ncbi:uncharacterized protein LOC131287931 [Anopheles ziemanni]|uniref:uncharacterized protein LOC131258542 n=1 Tax=Anopheles coustani TaxID=139045 RepID=UPI002657F0B0|nr:uncharacterized protein LOC131258542 [Anopheles coustani]XP_058173009.1 uncharacterized protein LOC131287931 [Anopheles ziemanni]
MASNTVNEPKFRNIELKAKLDGPDGYQRRVAIAKELTNSEGTVIHQNDVFFVTSVGRLKLRYLTHKKSELISYSRPDVPGPKLSEYSKMDIDEPHCLEEILAETIGVRGRVVKRRLLFLYGQTRVHLDEVEQLGNYLEFEVVLKPNQTIEEGQAIVEDLKRTFELDDHQLITGAYIDHIEKNKVDS